MKRSLAHALTQLHARNWRERYGDEFIALLESLPPTVHIVANALASALRSRTPAIFATALMAGLAIVVASLGGSQPRQHSVAQILNQSPHSVSPCQAYSQPGTQPETGERPCLT